MAPAVLGAAGVRGRAPSAVVGTAPLPWGLPRLAPRLPARSADPSPSPDSWSGGHPKQPPQRARRTPGGALETRREGLGVGGGAVGARVSWGLGAGGSLWAQAGEADADVGRRSACAGHRLARPPP